MKRANHRATLEKNAADVASMFDEVAPAYDVTNTVLTGGLVHVWRKTVCDALRIRPGMSVLDVAAGTGTSSAVYAQAGADVTAYDFSEGMIAHGRQRHPQLAFVQGDAMNMPFADESFDAVTISYGLRNVQDPDRALREMLRVVKPGGELVVCEFSTPVNPAFHKLYTFFLGTALPALAHVVSSDPTAYSYLTESILSWPDQQELGLMILDAGWRDVEFKNLTGGIVAVHRARKPLVECCRNASRED
ncbi:MAG: demethylmenaquinone methyltransferase [Actinomycetaceae bacterium]|nr:demethylmenaquinone methyltransferase [Actinomycetaceae bacterium]MDY5854193.1 demethylmenaquinone methyltransferase [Arcanobacterium sp.]